MASVNGVSSSSTSGIFGNRNIFTGMASGLDTEALIENSVSGYKNKIIALQKRQQKILWKQDAYRSIIDKMAGITRKYTSYSSSTNLFSSAFFNKAVNTTANGANAGKVTATGKTSSSVQINAIKQLATAAKYSSKVGAGNNALGGVMVGSKGEAMAAGEAINWDEKLKVSDISGSLTLTYGTKSIELNFDELEEYNSAEELAKGIEKKLSELSIATSSGESVKADTRIGVNVAEDGTISFSDKAGAGNSIYISSASDNIQKTLGIEPGKEATSIQVKEDTKMYHETDLKEYLAGKSISVTLDGVTKKITIPETLKDSENPAQDMVDELNKSLEKAFGEDKIKVSNDDGKLTFEAKAGSSFAVGSDVGEALGIGKTGLTSYLNTSKTLGDLGVLDGLESLKAEGAVTERDGKFFDVKGNLVQAAKDADGNELKDENGKTIYERIDSEGNPLYELRINDTRIGTFSKDTAMESVVLAINSNTEAGVSVSYSKLTNEFVFTAKETGEAGQISMGEGLAQKLFGDSEGKVEAGQDAILDVTINGSPMQLTRSSNVVDLDGLSVTLNGTFGYDESGKEIADTEAITFTSKADTDKIVDAIKSFVDDYNALITEVHDAYSTLPATKSNNARYEPLTEDDKANMSESAIAAYEEKAKQGILFGDRDLSSLYDKLRSAISPGGSDGGVLRSIGIDTNYSDGLTTISLDETKLREALETNPDKVKDAFVKTKEGGAQTNGLMQNVKTTLDNYASTSLASPGILVQKAGTKLSSLSLMNNSLQKEMDSLDDQIDRWQDKMSDRVDYYTRQFTILEQMVAQMNSQSSALAGLMGGGSSGGY